MMFWKLVGRSWKKNRIAVHVIWTMNFVDIAMYCSKSNGSICSSSVQRHFMVRTLPRGYLWQSACVAKHLRYYWYRITYIDNLSISFPCPLDFFEDSLLLTMALASPKRTVYYSGSTAAAAATTMLWYPLHFSINRLNELFPDFTIGNSKSESNMSW